MTRSSDETHPNSAEPEPADRAHRSARAERPSPRHTDTDDSPSRRRDEGDSAPAPHVAVRITRSGGVAGITRRWHAQAPVGNEQEWVTVINECPWDETRPTLSRPDGFTWRIVAIVRHDERSVTLPESAAVGPWATLIDVVRAASAEAPPA